ncbi:hypothetical protein NDU88_001090 [Pleurodeles waltl]|uniref:Carrier domain-containing protein n=1 Tax=Pleurodeles waltl TaxID=8319 RepID=A0AAV7UUC3_PLEWA|nr:hypothetical protein NDU88_001090 [Pleurodeles waltl]
MDLGLNSIDTLKVAKFKKLCKERGLTVGKRTTNVDFELALRTFEAVSRMQATTDEPEMDDPENEEVDIEEDDEEGNGLATGPEPQQQEE